MTIEKKVFSTINRYNMIQKEDNVIVALSGGADSMALFHFLFSHRDTLKISLAVAHFEHGIRGEASQQDALFVKNICMEYNVPFYLEHGNMANEIMPKNESTESWARKLRYAFFAKLSCNHNATVATAHTMSDTVETVLFNVLRGTGPKGLAGIPPVRGYIIRPFLDVSREEVETYCKANELYYANDKTNKERIYTRNKVRMDLLPEVEKIHPGAKQSIYRMAVDMRELSSWLDELAGEVLTKAAQMANKNPTMSENTRMIWKKIGQRFCAVILIEAPRPVRLQALSLLAGQNTSRTMLARMEKVLLGQAISCQLQKGRAAYLLQGDFFILEAGEHNIDKWEISLKTGVLEFPNAYSVNVKMRQSIDDFTNNSKFGKKSLTFVADYDRISICSVFRNRRPSDRFTFCDRKVSKTIKKWMNEEAFDAKVRNQLPLLADEESVFWIWGEGFSLQVQPTVETKRFLVIEQIEKG